MAGRSWSGLRSPAMAFRWPPKWSGAGFDNFLNSRFSQALASEFDPVGIVDETVEDRVSDRWASNHLMPTIDGNLAGDEDRPDIHPVFDNFEEIARLLVREDFRPPVIKDEEFD